MNKGIFIGNLTRNPEWKMFGDDGVCNFTVAVNRRTKKDHPETDYVRVSAWGKRGESCMNYLSKGKKVMVCGALRVSAYIAQDGHAVGCMELVADEIEFLTPRHGADQEATPPAAAEPVPAGDDDCPW